MLYNYSVSGFVKVKDIHPTGHMEICRPGEAVEYEGQASTNSAADLRKCLECRYDLIKPWIVIWQSLRKAA